MDISGQTVAIWCRDPVEQERIAAVLLAQELRPVFITDPGELITLQPPCAVFHCPPLDDPDFAASCQPLADWPIGEMGMIIIRLRDFLDDRLGASRSSLSNIRFTGFVLLPYDDEELALRVKRNVRIYLGKREK